MNNLTQQTFVSKLVFVLCQLTCHILIQQSTKASTIIYGVTHALSCSLLNLVPRTYAGKDIAVWHQESSQWYRATTYWPGSHFCVSGWAVFSLALQRNVGQREGKHTSHAKPQIRDLCFTGVGHCTQRAASQILDSRGDMSNSEELLFTDMDDNGWWWRFLPLGFRWSGIKQNSTSVLHNKCHHCPSMESDLSLRLVFSPLFSSPGNGHWESFVVRKYWKKVEG